MPSNPADAIVDRSFAKQQGVLPHPLDDSFLSVNAAKNDVGDQSYNGLCEKFVEQQTYGQTGLYPTAIDAWNDYSKQGKAIMGDVTNAPRGSIIYWNADNSNFGDGHASIADGQGNMISSTSQGVQQIPISQWQQTTNQQPLGYVIPN